MELRDKRQEIIRELEKEIGLLSDQLLDITKKYAPHCKTFNFTNEPRDFLRDIGLWRFNFTSLCLKLQRSGLKEKYLGELYFNIKILDKAQFGLTFVYSDQVEIWRLSLLKEDPYES